MRDLPPAALSIRQPWAWAIINAGKDVENRSWQTKFRGPVCIHASKGCTVDEHFWAARRISRYAQGLVVPDLRDLSRGGIIGVADIVDCVSASASRWFDGDFGFVLANVRPVEFIPCKGALGFFKWSRANA